MSPSPAPKPSAASALEAALPRTAAADSRDADRSLLDAVRAMDAAGEAASALAVLVARPDVILRLDEAVRRHTYEVRGTREGEAEAAQSPLGLALASCHPDGRVRERAARRLHQALGQPDAPPGLVPFLVVRTADWAGPVREGARAALALLLHDAPDRLLPSAAPVTLLVARRERGDFARQQLVLGLSRGGAHADRLLAATEVRLRRLALQTALAGSGRRMGLAELVGIARRDTDRRCRELAGETAVREAVWAERDDLLRQLAAKGNREVRALALIGLIRRGLTAEVPTYLADPSPLVRAVARDAARRTGTDARAWYRTTIEAAANPAGARGVGAEAAPGADAPGASGAGADTPAAGGAQASPPRAGGARVPTGCAHGVLTPGVVAGLGEVGGRGDAGVLTGLLGHAHPHIRVAALRALRAVDAVSVEDTVPLLRDPSARVVNAAVGALRNRELPAGLAQSLLADRDRAAVRRAGFRLLAEPDPLRQLLATLPLTADPDPRLARWAADASAALIRGFHTSPWRARTRRVAPVLAPDPEQRRELLALAEAAAPLLGHRPRQLLLEHLDPAGPQAELLRLCHGPHPDTANRLPGLDATFTADDPHGVIALVREALLAVLPRYAAAPADAWPESLDDWVGRYGPGGAAGGRGWRWWDAGVTGFSRGWVCVAVGVEGHPGGGRAALVGLIEAAGGRDVGLSGAP
jgi:hypothetical protein